MFKVRIWRHTSSSSSSVTSPMNFQPLAAVDIQNLYRILHFASAWCNSESALDREVHVCVCACVPGSIGNRHAGWGECGCIKRSHNKNQPPTAVSPCTNHTLRPSNYKSQREKKNRKGKWKKKKAVPKPLVSLCALWWSQLQSGG
jgi:hypothetical protein